MAVTFDTKFEKGSTAIPSPFSFTSNAGTVAGTVGSNTNRVLIGIVAFEVSVATVGTVAMTWAGNAMTAIGSGVDVPGGGGFSIFLFGLKGDASVTTGNQTLSVSWTGGDTTVILGAISLYNCNTTTGWQNFNSATGSAPTSASVTITTASGNMVVAGRIDANATSATMTSGTQDWDDRNFNGNSGGAHKASASGSEAITWSVTGTQSWAMAGADVVAASASSSSVSPSVSPSISASPSPTPSSSVSPSVSRSPSPSASQSPSSSVSPSPVALLIVERTVFDYID